MKSLKYVVGIVLVMTLAACGGGGGNPGTSSGGTAASADPLLTASLVDATGAATNSIGASGYTVLNVALRDPSGGAIPNQVIEVAGDASKVIFPEGNSALTNSAGVATVKLSRASLVASGAGSLTVTFSNKLGSITTYPNGATAPKTDKVISIGYQLSAANITLTNMDAGASTLAAYGTRQVSVQANINGVPVSSTPVQVNFTATCGQISPATASTNSMGLAVASYTATDATGSSASTLGCSGKTVEISASTIGAAVVSKSLGIAAAPATNLSFVSSRPSMIFLDNSGGATQAVVEFKLINARGEAILGQDVSLTLRNQSPGVAKASFGTVGNTAAVIVTTDANGKVSVPVFSGTVPTSVVVNAALVSNPLVQTDSAILTIASGRAAQDRVSLSIKDFSIEGFNVDGVTTDVTLSLADRQGNPVPDGTAVNFVTEGGVMIPPVCYTGGVKDPVTGVFSAAGNSQCAVTIRSQAPRPANGRVSILAYVAGEEDFVDKNFNNIYDAGDSFTDLGNAFRDDNDSLTFDTGEFSVPRTGGPRTDNGCPGYLGRPDTCDGVWGAADVRKQLVVVFATSFANIIGSVSPNTLTVTISDQNGNSMPTGSTVEASGAIGIPGGNVSGCSIASESRLVISNTTAPSNFSFSYICDQGDLLTVKVTTPLGSVTSQSFTAVGQPLVCIAPQVAQNGVCVTPPAPDTAPPTFPAGDPSVDQITQTSFRLTAMINEGGTGYYLLQNRTASPAVCPSVSALILSGSTVGMSGNTPAAVSFTGTPATSYAICFVARDAAGNTQTTVKTVGPFTTLP